MKLNSKIEWTDTTWSPVTGCTKVSPGCDHCYAEGIARRFAGSKAFPGGFDVTLRPERLDAPLRWRKPRRVFVDSMSDLFHEKVSDDFLARVWAVMAATPQHTYQILTKRHGRMKSLINSDQFRERAFLSTNLDTGELHGDDWPLPNVWLGVSVEDRFQWDGAHVLADDGTLYTAADLAHPSGPRRSEAIAVRHDQAHLTNMYRVGKKAAGRELDGLISDEFPPLTPGRDAS